MSELLKRALSGLVYVVLVLCAIGIDPFLFALVFLMFSLVGFVEYWNFSKSAINPKVLIIGLFLGFTVYSCVYLLLANKLQFGSILISVLVGCLTLPIILSLLFRKFALDWRQVFEGLIYTFLPFALLNAIFYFTVDGYSNQAKPDFLFVLFASVWLNDTMAYLVGKQIGKTKLAPKISPKKTWEGFIGGGLFSMLIATLLFPSFLSIDKPTTLIISGIAFIVGTVGDLLESKLKRKAGIKDSGKIMPGHGGVLDRLDSIILAGPVLLLYLIFAHHIF